MVRSADVVVLFAVSQEEGEWTLRSLAHHLGVKHSRVQRALDRLERVNLYDAARRQIVPHAAEEFVIHALPYLHPADIGPITRGVPTAWAAAPLDREIVSDDLPPVWPDPMGRIRGQAVEPLDARLPALAEKWPEVAELAALSDAIRIGDARSRAAAKHHLHERLTARS